MQATILKTTSLARSVGAFSGCVPAPSLLLSPSKLLAGDPNNREYRTLQGDPNSSSSGGSSDASETKRGK